MNLVKKRQDLIDNIETLEGYLTSKSKKEKEWAIDRVINAEKLVIYKVNGENHFAPYDFLALKGNSIAEHDSGIEEFEMKKLRDTVTSIVGNSFNNETTEARYAEYLKTIGKKPPKIERVFWRIKDERGKNYNLKRE